MMELCAEVDGIDGSVIQLPHGINSRTSGDQELSCNQSMIALILPRVANSDDDHDVLQSLEGNQEPYEGDNILDGGLFDKDMEVPSIQVSHVTPTHHLVFPSEEGEYF